MIYLKGPFCHTYIFTSYVLFSNDRYQVHVQQVLFGFYMFKIFFHETNNYGHINNVFDIRNNPYIKQNMCP